MKHFFISLTLLLCFLMPAMAQSDVQVTEDTRATWVASARQVIDYLLDKHANHNRIYDARDFGLPAPDTLRLKTRDGLNLPTRYAHKNRRVSLYVFLELRTRLLLPIMVMRQNSSRLM